MTFVQKKHCIKREKETHFQRCHDAGQHTWKIEIPEHEIGMGIGKTNADLEPGCGIKESTNSRDTKHMSTTLASFKETCHL